MNDFRFNCKETKKNDMFTLTNVIFTLYIFKIVKSPITLNI